MTKHKMFTKLKNAKFKGDTYAVANAFGIALLAVLFFSAFAHYAMTEVSIVGY